MDIEDAPSLPFRIFVLKVEQERGRHGENPMDSSLYKMLEKISSSVSLSYTRQLFDGRFINMNNINVIIRKFRGFFNKYPSPDNIFYLQTLFYSNVTIHDIYSALMKRDDDPEEEGEGPHESQWIRGPRDSPPRSIIPTIDGTYEYFIDEQGFPHYERKQSIENLHHTLAEYAKNYENASRYRPAGDTEVVQPVSGTSIADYARNGQLAKLKQQLRPNISDGLDDYYYLLSRPKQDWNLYELMVVTEEVSGYLGTLSINQKYLYKVPPRRRVRDGDRDRAREINLTASLGVRIRAFKLYNELNRLWNQMGMEPISIPKRLAAQVLRSDTTGMQTLLGVESLRTTFAEFIQSRNRMHRDVVIKPIRALLPEAPGPFWFVPNDPNNYWKLRDATNLYIQMTLFGTKVSRVSSLREIKFCIVSSRDPAEETSPRLVKPIQSLSEAKNATSIVALSYQAGVNDTVDSIENQQVKYYAVYNEKYERLWQQNKKLLQRIPNMDFLIPGDRVDPWILEHCAVGVHMYRYERPKIEQYITDFEGSWSLESMERLMEMRKHILMSLMRHVDVDDRATNYDETVFLLEQAKTYLDHHEESKSVEGELLTKLQKLIPTFFDRDTLDDLLSRYKNLDLIKKSEEREQEGEVQGGAPADNPIDVEELEREVIGEEQEGEEQEDMDVEVDVEEQEDEEMEEGEGET